MTQPTSLEVISALDLDERILRELLRLAYDDGHPRIIGRLLRLRAENEAATSQAMGRKPVHTHGRPA